MTASEFKASFEEDFREELADLAGVPVSSGDRILTLTLGVEELILRLEAAHTEALYQRNRADELERRIA